MTVVCTSNWQLDSRKQGIAGMPRAQQSDVVAIASLSLGDRVVAARTDERSRDGPEMREKERMDEGELRCRVSRG
jgi:hypothetical protein